MNKNRLLFLFFLLSGFCGLLYQVVWLRLAYSHFGVITPVISSVVSVFMFGLGLGSLLAGDLVKRWQEKIVWSSIGLYGLCEFLIGLSAFCVPYLFDLSEHYLLGMGELDSGKYLLFSFLAVTLSLLPWCTAMGATFPLVMAFMKEEEKSRNTSFSFLYLANITGAVIGVLSTAFVLIELCGLHHTLQIAAGCNFLIAFICLCWAKKIGPKSKIIIAAQSIVDVTAKKTKDDSIACALLFLTGFVSLAMEIAWIRAFMPMLGNEVYSFAQLLAVYLIATFLGSYLYRRHLKFNAAHSRNQLLAAVAICAALPVVLNNTALPLFDLRIGSALALVSIIPFSFVLGYLTPKLVDEYSQGDPQRAGYSYAINTWGCIVGPLVAGYFLLPTQGSKATLIFLSLLIFIAYLLIQKNSKSKIFVSLAVVALLSLGAFAADYECGKWLAYDDLQVRRDYAATVISGKNGKGKVLLVNGLGMTTLTPVTKYMVHLPMAALQTNSNKSILLICFGMGTTYRSALKWNAKTTAVELIPSVKDAFPYYHADAIECLKNPNGKIVVDDGRRFLKRTNEKFDVISLDLPPPIPAAGSSLLYSKDFYVEAKRHLTSGGIVQQWFPGEYSPELRSVAGAINSEFPYVRAYRSIEGWGYYFLASEKPIPQLTADQFISSLPPAAAEDVLEWETDKSKGVLRARIEKLIAGEVPLQNLLNTGENTTVTDDRPYTEYYWLRDKLSRQK